MDGEEDEFGFLDDADAHESVGASSSSSSFAGRGRDDNAGQQRRPYSATVTVTAHGRNGENPRGLSLTEKVAAVLEYLKGKERNEMISMAEIAEDTGIVRVLSTAVVPRVTEKALFRHYHIPYIPCMSLLAAFGS